MVIFHIVILYYSLFMDVFTACSTTKGLIYESERKLSKETVNILPILLGGGTKLCLVYIFKLHLDICISNMLISSAISAYFSFLKKKLKVYQCISVHVFTEIQLGSLHHVTSTHTQNEQDAN